jgi:heat shock protein HtpX
MANQLKTILLLSALSVLLITIGGAISPTMLVVMIAFAVVVNVGAFLHSDKLVLRMSRARVVERHEAPGLCDLIRDLADRAQLPMPKVAIVPDATPNAFATGRDPQRAVVAVTEGLLRLTDQRELRGVIAHELAHIKHRDTLIATIAAAAAAAITSVAQVLQWCALFGGVSSDDEEGSSGMGVLLTAVLAPIGAVMIQAGISRSREYIADEYAAELTADPKGLANALAKLQRYGQQLMQRGAPMPQPATTSLSIVNPLSGLSGRGAGIANLFSTHPPIEQRIKRLMAMA